MKIAIIGAVAGGTSAAAKARRNSETAEITIFEQDQDISYSSCGLPYYISGEISERKNLTPRDEAFFQKRYNIQVKTRHQVLEIDPAKKKLRVQNLITEEEFFHAYDKLVLATGASSKILPLPGADLANVFPLRNVVSADRIKEYIAQNSPQKAVIIGSGFIGLELADAFLTKGMEVTIIEAAKQPMPPLDEDMSVYLEKYLLKKGVNLVLGDITTALQGTGKVEKVILDSGQEIATDLVIMAVGIRPNVELAQKAGLELGETGAIKVNKKMETSLPDIYAVGDCAEAYSLLTGKPLYRPLGTTANKMGRIAGENITGGHLEFRGILGTGIFKIGEYTVAQTGLSEREAFKEGYSVEIAHNIKPNQQTYYPGGSELVIKAVADKKSKRLLGAQIFGRHGVDKRIDVLATAISLRATVEDLFHLDLAYAPPYATTKDPVAYTGMILSNAISGGRPLISPTQLETEQAQGKEIIIIDVRDPKQYEQSHLQGAINIPLEQLREKLQQLDREKNIVVYCNGGVSGNSVQNTLINYGFKQVRNLSGGHKQWEMWKK